MLTAEFFDHVRLPAGFGGENRTRRRLRANHEAAEARLAALMLSEADMRRAFYARDPAFDGQFVTAVVTTGIYCRCACPARKPNPQNVRFYADADAARAGGFRACLRCKPDEAPASLVASALALAREDPAAARPERLARALGVSTRRLAREFRAQTGEPLARFLRRRRVLEAADALRAGATVGAAARVAGFASRSAFHLAFRRLKGQSPRRWRLEQ